MTRTRVLPAAGVAAVLLIAPPAPAGDIAPNFPIFNVPLTIHVVRQDNGAGGLSSVRVGQAIIDANVAFQPMGIYFCQIGPTLFVDDDFYYFDAVSFDDYAALKQVNPVPDTINIYFTENMGCPSENQSDCPNPAICGISSYTGSRTQGIVMRNSCTGVPEDRSTIAHEIGHYFNLYHTQDTVGGTECPDGSNCAFTGDKICDTPASPRLDLDNVTAQCVYDGPETACGQAYDPDVCNHMSYAPKPCRDAFTLQQVAKARATLQNYRPQLILDPGCPAPGACSLASGPCNVAHDTPGCNDGPCCMDVCDLDLYCCAAEWDATCVWKRSFVCLDIVFPSWGDPGHAPLGDATLAIDPSSGALVVSNLAAGGNDGVVAELDFAESMDMTWLDPDPADALPIGASMRLSLNGWTGLPRPQPAGSSTATKLSGGEVNFVAVTADLGPATARVYNGSSLVAEATVPSGPVATAPVMPTGGGIPATLDDGARLHWSWAAPVFIQIEGGPAATGTRLEIHADAGPRVRRFAMIGLQADGPTQIDITAEFVTAATAPLNDDCRDPFLVGDETVSFAGESWYLYIASCSGPVTASAGSAGPVTAYTGTCDNLQRVGTGGFAAACGVPYLIHVAGPGAGTLTVACAGACVLPCTADLDGDNAVGIVDFLMLLAAWGPNAGHPADFDFDGDVGITDFLFLLSDWGPCPSLID